MRFLVLLPLIASKDQISLSYPNMWHLMLQYFRKNQTVKWKCMAQKRIFNQSGQKDISIPLHLHSPNEYRLNARPGQWFFVKSKGAKVHCPVPDDVRFCFCVQANCNTKQLQLQCEWKRTGKGHLWPRIKILMWSRDETKNDQTCGRLAGRQMRKIRINCCISGGGKCCTMNSRCELRGEWSKLTDEFMCEFWSVIAIIWPVGD